MKLGCGISDAGVRRIARGLVGLSPVEFHSVQEVFEAHPNDIFTTKELAEMLSVSTNSVYRQCVNLMEQGLLFKFGYRTRDGWEDPENSNLQTQSLGWEWYEKGER